MRRPPRLIHLVSSTFWGGREQYAMDICRAFAREGWNVTVLSRDAKAVDTPFRQGGLTVRHMSLGAYSAITPILRLARMLRRAPAPPAVHAHNFRDAFVALCARRLSMRPGVRVVLTCHRVKPGRDTPLRRRIMRGLDAMVFPSALARDTFLSTWQGDRSPVHPDKVHVLLNSVYLPDRTPSVPPSGPVTAAYYGRLVRGKGLETLIEALPALRGLRTRVCIAGTGDPDYTDTLKRQATRLQVMDLIDWSVNAPGLETILDRAHMGVFPYSAPEAFGLGAAACMALGRPQVCSDSGAQGEYLTDGSEALLVPPGDSEALAGALRRLATDPALRQFMGQAARERFERQLSWPRFARDLESIYLGRP